MSEAASERLICRLCGGEFNSPAELAKHEAEDARVYPDRFPDLSPPAEESQQSEAEDDDEDREGLAPRFVYFIQAGDRPYVKIGRASHSPDSRLPGLQTGSPDPLWVRAYLDCGICLEAEAYAIERGAQDRFRESLVRGEWYKVTEELEGFMYAIVKGRVRICAACGTRPVTTKEGLACAVCLNTQALPRSRRTAGPAVVPSLGQITDVMQMAEHLDSARNLGLKQLYSDGLTLAEIATTMELSLAVVKGNLHTLGLSVHLSRDIRILRDRGKDPAEIAEQLGLRDETVKERLAHIAVCDWLGWEVQPSCVHFLNGDRTDPRRGNVWIFRTGKDKGRWRAANKRDGSCPWLEPVPLDS